MMTAILDHPLQISLALVALQYGLRELFHGLALLRPVRQLQAA